MSIAACNACYALLQEYNIDNVLSLSSHCSSIVNKASRKINLIYRTFLSGNRDNFVRAFTVYVRPMLEYCSTVWSPYCSKHIKLIEAVQRRFTKRLPGLRDLSYAQRLKELNLESLHSRRTKADLLMTYKILFGLVNVDRDKFFSLAVDNANFVHTRGHQFKLNICRARLNARKHFFSSRIVSIWNSLPSSVDYSSLRAFKTSLTSFSFDSIIESKTAIINLFT